jgi:4'-phosphopantetheinyl transferase
MSPAELAQLSDLLDEAERARAARFHFKRDRRHYIAARGLLRSLLGSARNEPASELVFEYGPHGKPALAPRADRDGTLHFNVSHSSGWGMFVLNWHGEVGIDLEANFASMTASKSFSALPCECYRRASWRSGITCRTSRRGAQLSFAPGPAKRPM